MDEGPTTPVGRPPHTEGWTSSPSPGSESSRSTHRKVLTNPSDRPVPSSIGPHDRSVKKNFFTLGWDSNPSLESNFSLDPEFSAVSREGSRMDPRDEKSVTEKKRRTNQKCVLEETVIGSRKSYFTSYLSTSQTYSPPLDYHGLWGSSRHGVTPPPLLHCTRPTHTCPDQTDPTT